MLTQISFTVLGSAFGKNSLLYHTLEARHGAFVCDTSVPFGVRGACSQSAALASWYR